MFDVKTILETVQQSTQQTGKQVAQGINRADTPLATFTKAEPQETEQNAAPDVNGIAASLTTAHWEKTQAENDAANTLFGSAADLAARTWSNVKATGETLAGIPSALASGGDWVKDWVATPSEFVQAGAAATAPSIPKGGRDYPEAAPLDESVFDTVAANVKGGIEYIKEQPTGLFRNILGAVKNRLVPTYVPVLEENGTTSYRAETEEEKISRLQYDNARIQEKYTGTEKLIGTIIENGIDPVGLTVARFAGMAIAPIANPAAAKAVVDGAPQVARAVTKYPGLKKMAIAGTATTAYELPNAALEYANREGEVDGSAVLARGALAFVAGSVVERTVSLASAIGKKHGPENVAIKAEEMMTEAAKWKTAGLNEESAVMRGMKHIGLEPTVPDEALAGRTSAEIAEEFVERPIRPVSLEHRGAKYDDVRESSKRFETGFTKPSASEQAFALAREESKRFETGFTKPSLSDQAITSARESSKQLKEGLTEPRLNISKLKGQRGSVKILPDYLANGQYGVEVVKNGAKVHVTGANTFDEAVAKAQKMADATGAKVRVIDPLKKDSITLITPSKMGTKGDPFGKQRGYIRTPFGSSLDNAPKGPKVPGLASQVFTPLHSAMKEVAPIVAERLRKHDFSVLERSHQYVEPVKDFLEQSKNLAPDLKRQITKALSTGSYEAAESAFRAAGRRDLADQLPMVRGVLARVFEDYHAVGINVNYRSGYFPQRVVDYAGLRKHMTGAERTAFDKAISAERTRKKRALTDEEQARVYAQVVRGGNKPDVHPGVGVRERQIKEISDDLAPYYDTFDSALSQYLSRAAKNVERAKFFGSHNVKELDDAENVEQSIGVLLRESVKNGDITMGEQVEVLERMLKSRFVGGEAASNKAVSGYRSFTYGTLLANPASAVQNMTDVAYAAFNSGLGNTIKGVAQTITGRGVKLADIHIDNTLQEISQRGLGADALDVALKYSGFRAMDVFGKETLVNAHVNAIKAQVKSVDGAESLIRKWAPALGGEDKAREAIASITSGNLTSDGKYVLVSNLADYHPVLPSEMPEAYLANPNGRVLYTLHTYQLKQLDVFRQQVFKEIKTNPGEGVKKLVTLTAYLSMAGVPVAWLQDMVRNRELRPMDDIVAGNLLKMVGLSTYGIDKNHLLISDPRRPDITGAMADVIMPPFAAFENVYDDLKKAGKQFNSLQHVPVAGKALYDWFGGGQEAYIKSQMWREAKEKREQAKKRNPAKQKRKEAEAEKRKQREIRDYKGRN